MRRLVVAIACSLLFTAAPASSQPTFTVDFQGPAGIPDSFFGVPISEGDILTTVLPGPPGPNPPAIGPLPPPGIEIGALFGAAGVVPGGLGVFPGLGGLVEVDALSYGRDLGNELQFSVDEFAWGAGVPTTPPDVATEGAVGAGEASADVFRYLGPVVPTPPVAVAIGNTIAIDGDGVAPPAGIAGLGLIEPNPPTAGFIPDPGHNLDGVDVDTTLGDLGGPIFFSLDSFLPDVLEISPPANSGTAVGNGFSGADVLVSLAGAFPAVAIPAGVLGLDLLGFDSDDLDALAFDDADGNLAYTPGEFIAFSVRRGSAVIGTPDSAFGVPISEGDVLTVPSAVGLPPALLIAAEAIGLGTLRSGTAGPFLQNDDLDALDVVQVGPPIQVPAVPPLLLAALAVVMLGIGALIAKRRA